MCPMQAMDGGDLGLLPAFTTWKSWGATLVTGVNLIFVLLVHENNSISFIRFFGGTQGNVHSKWPTILAVTRLEPDDLQKVLHDPSLA